MTEDDALRAVRDAWAETLAVDPADVPIDVGFFDAGGNSLLLVMLSERLGDDIRRPLPVVDLFQHPTVRAQAELLSDDQ
ncbi:acyl carrier protein [Streptomyces sp. NPDC002742]|uniref:acyl carrier protein n=1 Tax=Streptomyces sp. NPDC002742 TaxID=3364663 RepID=UPI0036D0110D